ncbi:MAG: hypothetical protein KIH62_000365 [Candidatus Kerfeldbacteria bacterium]|nr:hypothetical protein [Candidatus Kerfeldbacteria bacterium]
MKRNVAPKKKKITLQGFYTEFKYFRDEMRLFRMESNERFERLEKFQERSEKTFDNINTNLDTIMQKLDHLNTERFAMISSVERLEKKVFGS